MTQIEQPHRYGDEIFAAEAGVVTRADFIRKTYLHLAGAILAFIGVELVIFQTVNVEAITMSMLGGYSWLIVLGAFMLVSWLAHSWASSATSIGVQYAGLAVYVIAQAVIFVPLLFIADRFNQGQAYGGHNIIATAAVTTLTMFGGLTGFVLISGKDFSFLRGALVIGGIAALMLIVASIYFKFDLGIIFTIVMIALACGFILYDTSNVLHHYRIGQHVAASLALFASVALLFWYVLQLLMYLQGRD